jgi:hypothetical protein
VGLSGATAFVGLGHLGKNNKKAGGVCLPWGFQISISRPFGPFIPAPLFSLFTFWGRNNSLYFSHARLIINN